MKKIQLTGIGNALVDLEYEVTDDDVATFGVEKGGMTLTDHERQAEIITALGERTVRKSSGGSVANSMIAFAQFGGKAGFVSIVGDDENGTFYVSEFRELGIVFEARMVEAATTGSCIVFVTPDSERTLNTTLAVNEQFNEAHVGEDIVAASEWLLIEGYKLTDDNGAAAIDKALFYAKKHDTNIAVSCSDPFIVNVFGDRLKTVLNSADVVICNEAEGTALAEEHSYEKAWSVLQQRFRNVVFTKGAEGSNILWQQRTAQIPSYKVTAVDATGAGDMYAGAFMFGALNNVSIDKAGRLASYAAAQVVAQYGARLRTSHIDILDDVLSGKESNA